MLVKKPMSYLIALVMIVIYLIVGKETVFAAPDPPAPDTLVPISTVFNDPIRVSGDGSQVVAGGKVLIINPNKPGQLGAIWSKQPISIDQNFVFRGFLYLGNAGTGAADGMTFTFTADPRLESALTYNQVIGGGGGALGVYGTNTGGALPEEFVRNALTLEFDTWYNDAMIDMDRELSVNGKRGHIAFATPYRGNAKGGSGQHKAHAYASAEFGPLSNGQWHPFEVRWNASSQTMSYVFYKDPQKSMQLTGSYRVPDVNKQFGGSRKVYWGFTSSTGTYSEENALAVQELPTGIKHSVKIRNKTRTPNGSFVDTRVYGSAGETIEIQDAFTFDPTFYDQRNSPKLVQSSLEYLVYKKGSLKINGRNVPPNEETSIVSQDGSNITIDLKNYFTNPWDTSASIVYETTVANKAKVGSGIAMNAKYTDYKRITGIGGSSNLSLEQFNDPPIASVWIEAPKTKSITVSYQDIDTGTALAPTKTISGAIGTSYNEQPINIPNYDFVPSATVGNSSGIYSLDTGNIIFKYKKKVVRKSITISYQDIDTGAALAPTKTISGEIGTQYVEYPLNIPGYEVVMTSTVGHPIDKFSENSEDVIFKYRKIPKKGTVEVRYIDMTRHAQIIPMETYTGMVGERYSIQAAGKVPEGYVLKDQEGDAQGYYTEETKSVTFYYVRVTDLSKVELSVNKTTVSPGDTITYTLKYTGVDGQVGRFTELKAFFAWNQEVLDRTTISNITMRDKNGVEVFPTYHELVDGDGDFRLMVKFDKKIPSIPVADYMYTFDVKVKEDAPPTEFTSSGTVAAELRDPSGLAWEDSDKVKIKVIKDQKINVHFVDKDKKAVHSDVVISDVSSGSTVNVRGNPQVQIALREIFGSQNYTIDPINWDDLQFKVGDEDVDVYYFFSGKIRFDSVSDSVAFQDSYLSFVKQRIVRKDNSWKMSISDTRADSEKKTDKWSVTAKLENEFKTTDNKELPDVLYYSKENTDQSLLINSKEETPVISQSNVLSNNTVIQWNTLEDGLALKVPGGAAKKGTYKAKIIWNLSNVK